MCVPVTYVARGIMIDKIPEEKLPRWKPEQGAATSQIVYQAAHEMRQSEKHSSNWCVDIYVTKKLCEEDITSKKVPGGIHLVCRDPLVSGSFVPGAFFQEDCCPAINRAH